MYQRYFGFTVKPFQITADPRFLWMGEKHKEGLSVLRYGVLDNRGFLLLTGDVGTGKTTLLNALLEVLYPDVLVARVSDPRLSVPDFIRHVSAAFGLKTAFSSKAAFLAHFEAFLHKQHNLGRRVLLIIDEAQRLSYELLEEIRALSNLEKPSAKLLNVFLVGQEEFNELLLDERCRALRQRITVNYHLEPLNRKEVGEYILHRQKVAGGRRNLFSEKAVDLIYSFSEGLPRLINVICDHALLAAYAENKKFVSDRVVAECAGDLEIRSFIRTAGRSRGLVPFAGSEPKTGAAPGPPRPRARKRGLTALMILFFLFLGGYSAYHLIPGSGRWLRSVTGQSLADRQADANGGPPGLQTGAEKKIFPESKDPMPEIHERLPAPAEVPAASLNDAPGAARPESGIQIRRENGTRGPVAESGLSDQIPATASAGGNANDRYDERRVREMPGTRSVKTSEFKAGPELPEPLVVYFQHDTYGIDSRSFKTLDRARKLMTADPELEAVVVGYTDARGDPRYNLWLSGQRARIVKSYLTGTGVEEDRIDARGLGALNPRASNQTPEGRADNRRVEIRFGYGLR